MFGFNIITLIYFVQLGRQGQKKIHVKAAKKDKGFTTLIFYLKILFDRRFNTQWASQFNSLHIDLVSELISLERISPFVCLCAYKHVKVESEQKTEH